MVVAKCQKCGGSATGDTYEEASGNINHAVGLSRGIKCGANYNMVYKVKDTTPKESTPIPPKKLIPIIEKPKESTSPKPKESQVTEKSKSTKSKSFK